MKIDELKLLIKEGEGLTVEFKERFTNKIDKDIVAFANSKGGYLILGVNDDGKIVGEKLTNKLKAAITDLARKCDPSISVKQITQVADVVVVEIAESDEQPHSCSHGFYRRLDAITQKMTQKEIKVLFEENEFKSAFEERINDDATFDDISEKKIKAFFKAAKIPVTDINVENVLASLSLSKGSAIKNAGVLFFDKDPRRKILQCQMFMVAFKGTSRVDIYDRIDIQDDLLTQYNEAQIFLKKHLNVRTEITGFDREDIYEIPLDALREAIANAIIHRDYGVRGTSIMVEVHDDRVVISNPGRLPKGVDIKTLINGVSMRRNELIADIFARMDKAERMGSGLKRIGEIMQEAKQPFPEIENDLFFRITFKRPFYDESTSKVLDESLEINADMVLNKIENNPSISAKKLAEIFKITPRAIEKHISNLKAAGLLKRVGSKKHGHWKVIK
ncbi:MAG: helix-turn-helix domain-containing protein [Gammaproteobacteria bacterium]|jgi:ATP-dependent DNA helicase RecG